MYQNRKDHDKRSALRIVNQDSSKRYFIHFCFLDTIIAQFLLHLPCLKQLVSIEDRGGELKDGSLIEEQYEHEADTQETAETERTRLDPDESISSHDTHDILDVSYSLYLQSSSFKLFNLNVNDQT